MTRRERPGRGGRGLTLLELVITLTILSMVGIIALQALRLGSRSWQRGERRVDMEQKVRILSAILTQDLAALQPVTAEVNGRQVLAFQGGSDWLFFHTGPSGYGALPWSAMVRGVGYKVDPEKGLVFSERYPLAEGRVSLEPGESWRTLDPDVTRLNVRYLAPASAGEEPRWVEAWDSRGFPAGSSATGGSGAIGQSGAGGSPPAITSRGLPLVVEVSIVTREEKGEREFILLLPIRLAQSL